jgi:TonB family protein
MNINLYPHLLFALTLATPAVAQLSTAPADYVPLKIIQTEDAIFPLRLRNTVVMNGDAWVVIKVDHQDQLEDLLVSGYTRKEFADEAVRAIKSWKYETTRLRGEKWGTIREVHFIFSRSGVVISQSGYDAQQNYMERLMPGGPSFRCCTLRELDRIPVPSKVVSPGYPKELADQGVKGKVVVEFYIDETGKVRMPGALDWVNDTLANLAVTAVKQWEFEPPLHKGKPVLLQVRQEFNFEPN